MSRETYYVYIMSNERNTTLYTGTTNNLSRRVFEHKSGAKRGFSKMYNVTKLVFFESFSSPKYAIDAEKRIKGGSRKKKDALINSINPEWKDLSESLG